MPRKTWSTLLLRARAQAAHAWEVYAETKAPGAFTVAEHVSQTHNTIAKWQQAEQHGYALITDKAMIDGTGPVEWFNASAPFVAWVRAHALANRENKTVYIFFAGDFDNVYGEVNPR